MTVHRTCAACGLLILQETEACPACGSESLRIGEVARAGPPPGPDLPPEPEAEEGPRSRPTEWEIVHPCPDELLALTLQAELERHGIPSWIRSLEVPGYQGLIHNQPVWGWLLVDREDREAAAEVIRDFLRSLDDGGPR